MESGEKLTVRVSSETAKMIREKVEDGSYASSEEVMSAALEALKREEEDHAARLASIKARIKASIQDTRPPIPLDEAVTSVKQRIAELARGKGDLARRRRS